MKIGPDLGSKRQGKFERDESGPEIKPLFVDRVYEAFAKGEEPTAVGIALLLTELTPLSKLMAEEIAALRKWAKGRARLASTVSKHEGLRRIAA